MTLTRAQVESMTPAQRRYILRMALPRLPERYIPHAPHPPQQVFLLDKRKEAFYGGAGGGGKSDALLMAALQYVDVPRYSALLLRRSWPDLSQPGAILERAQGWLGGTDAKPHEGGRYWTFPSGARLSFGYIQRSNDTRQFMSAEFQFIGWDELTVFPENPYLFMFSRLRQPAVQCQHCPVQVEKVGPGGRSAITHQVADGETGEDWVTYGEEEADGRGWVHIAGQTDYDKHCPYPSPNPRAMREYRASDRDGMTLFDVPLRMRSASNPGQVGHAWVRDRFINPETRIKTASFYPATIDDNPSLNQAAYRDSLSHLTTLDRARIEAGDWDITDEGAMFNRDWFKVVPAPGVPHKSIRYWDLAATKVKSTGDRNDPDWTCGALVTLIDGRWIIEDMVRIRSDPYDVERKIAATAAADGRTTAIRIEQEPGSSGKIVLDHYRRNVLVGYNVDMLKPTTSKEERAKLWAAAAKPGNVDLVEGRWTKDFLDEVSIFPYGLHDDQVDAVSGAVECWLKPKGSLII